MGINYAHGFKHKDLSTEKLSVLMRPADCYEERDIKLCHVVCGFYKLGHCPPLEVFDSAMDLVPGLCINTHRFDWVARSGDRSNVLPQFMDSEPDGYGAWIARPCDVVQTYWIRYRNGFAVSRAGKRGAFPVTALLVEHVSPTAGWGAGLHDRWITDGWDWERNDGPLVSGWSTLASGKAIITLSKTSCSLERRCP